MEQISAYAQYRYMESRQLTYEETIQQILAMSKACPDCDCPDGDPDDGCDCECHDDNTS